LIYKDGPSPPLGTISHRILVYLRLFGGFFVSRLLLGFDIVGAGDGGRCLIGGSLLRNDPYPSVRTT
jgi:hypothetical protein